eukprot:4658375-Prymnesium_polylepis.1
MAETAAAVRATAYRRDVRADARHADRCRSRSGRSDPSRSGLNAIFDRSDAHRRRALTLTLTLSKQVARVHACAPRAVRCQPQSHQQSTFKK